MLALALLNAGLVICCGGLLVWNLRLSRQVRLLGEFRRVFFDAVGEPPADDLADQFFVVDDRGFLSDSVDWVEGDHNAPVVH